MKQAPIALVSPADRDEQLFKFLPRAELSDAAHKLKGAVGYFNQSGLWQDVAEEVRRFSAS